MNSLIRRAVRLSLILSAGTALGAPAVLAQNTSSNATLANQSEGSATSGTAQLGKIEVTGTRILRTSTETAQPITIITAKQIQETGLVTIGEVLQNIAQGGAGLNLQSGNTGPSAGQSTLDLRYLGSNRVLVLVNGRRWTPGLDGSVDMSNIPASIIDHIEILQDGASAIYGSDAIAGVINIITIKNYNGGEANAYMGMYANNYGGLNSWDGKTQAYSFTIGTSGARSGVVMNASYTENDPIWASARVQTREPIWTQPHAGSSANAMGRFIVNIGNGAAPSNVTNCTPFIPAHYGNTAATSQTFFAARGGSCDMGLINVPENDPTLANFRNYESSDNFNYAPTNYDIMPLEVKSIYMQGHYDIADNVTFTSLGEFNVRSSQQALAPAPLFLGSGGTALYNGAVFGVGANNPYNPFHENLVANSSQFCPTSHYAGATKSGALSTCAPNNNLLLNFYGRRPIEAGLRSFTQNVENYTFRMGLNGFFDALGSEWDWDAGASYGNVYQNIVINGVFNTARLATALDAPGAAQCNGPGQTTKPSGQSVEVGGLYYPILSAGCVPANIFGGFNQQGNPAAISGPGQGSLTPAMISYFSYENHRITEMTMRDYTADITGDIAQLPAGPLAVALGVEYLEQDGFDHPDALAVEGNVDENAALPTQGRTWTNAEYVEFNIPLLSNLPLAKALSLDIANRWSQFSWTGGEETSSDFGVKHKASATTARAQIRWLPTTGLLLRASWAQGFRAPSLSELYAGRELGFPGVEDPCAPNTTFGSWKPGTPLPAGCHGLEHTQINGQIGTFGGGNPALTPETSISRSAGLVLSPSWLPGFDLSADYFKIDLGNVVGGFSANYILQQCYVQDNPQFCSRITTAAGGAIVSQISALSANTGEEYERGTDVAAHYRLPVTPIGSFTVGTSWTFMQSFVSVTPSSSSPTGWQSSEERGFLGIPQRKGSISLSWNQGDWAARWFIQYIGSVYGPCTGATMALNECSDPNAVYPVGQRNTQGQNLLGTTIYNDVETTYHLSEVNTDVTFGIRNLFNKQPPTPIESSMGIRVPGRFVYARVGVKF